MHYDKYSLSCIFFNQFSDIFSLICDNNGLLVQSKFADFLREILQVPCSVHESPTFGYRDNLPSSIIDGVCIQE